MENFDPFTELEIMAAFESTRIDISNRFFPLPPTGALLLVKTKIDGFLPDREKDYLHQAWLHLEHYDDQFDLYLDRAKTAAYQAFRYLAQPRLHQLQACHNGSDRRQLTFLLNEVASSHSGEFWPVLSMAFNRQVGAVFVGTVRTDSLSTINLSPSVAETLLLELADSVARRPVKAVPS